MKITRLGANKNDVYEVSIIDIEINGISYRLTETVDKKLSINIFPGKIAVFPGYANQIDVGVGP